MFFFYLPNYNVYLFVCIIEEGSNQRSEQTSSQ